MDNLVFYIQYKRNQPFIVDSHYKYDGGLREGRPLTKIYELLAVAATEPIRNLLGLPANFGPLTLHYLDANGNLIFLRPDLPLSELAKMGVGLTDQTPLIIQGFDAANGRQEHDGPVEIQEEGGGSISA